MSDSRIGPTMEQRNTATGQQMPGGHALARREDPETSWKAAQQIGDLREQQAKVWAVLREGPMIDEQLILKCRDAGLGMSDSGVRTRRSELVEAGLVVDSGQSGRTVRGRQSIKWRALALDEYRALQERQAQQPSLFGGGDG